MNIKLITLILFVCGGNLAAQNNNSIELSKGYIFDVLPLKFNENADSLSVKKYLSDSILPRAIELGYVPIKSIPIKTNGSIQGNYTPDVLIFGGWENQLTLDNAMKQLELEFSDFHSLRREIWTLFYNTHYELKENLSFNFLPGKIYVATAYWKKESRDIKNLIKETILSVKNNKGKIILELTEGESPYGYYYNPDLFYITEWDNENNFYEFMKAHQPFEKLNLKHINQFELSTK